MLCNCDKVATTNESCDNQKKRLVAKFFCNDIVTDIRTIAHKKSHDKCRDQVCYISLRKLFSNEFGTANVVERAVDIKFSGGSYIVEDDFASAVDC